MQTFDDGQITITNSYSSKCLCKIVRCALIKIQILQITFQFAKHFCRLNLLIFYSQCVLFIFLCVCVYRLEHTILRSVHNTHILVAILRWQKKRHMYVCVYVREGTNSNQSVNPQYIVYNVDKYITLIFGFDSDQWFDSASLYILLSLLVVLPIRSFDHIR